MKIRRSFCPISFNNARETHEKHEKIVPQSYSPATNQYTGGSRKFFAAFKKFVGYRRNLSRSSVLLVGDTDFF